MSRRNSKEVHISGKATSGLGRERRQSVVSQHGMKGNDNAC